MPLLTRYPNENKMYELNGEPEGFTFATTPDLVRKSFKSTENRHHTANPALSKAESICFVKELNKQRVHSLPSQQVSSQLRGD